MEKIPFLKCASIGWFALLAIAACSAGHSSTTASQSVPSQVTAAYESLLQALASCSQDAASCLKDAHGDPTALETCRAQLSDCRVQAGSTAENALASAIRDCTSAARQCAQNATTDAAHLACDDTLRACIGDNRPAHADDDDGGVAETHGAQVASCVAALHACIESNTEPMTCGQQMRACVLASVPVPIGVTPGDGHGDAGRPEAHDAGHPDAGHEVTHPEPPDAGRPNGPPPQASDAGRHDVPDAAMHMPEDAGHSDSSCMKRLQTCLAAGGDAATCHEQQKQCAKGMMH